MSELPRCLRCGGSLGRNYGTLPPSCLMCGREVPVPKKESPKPIVVARYKHDRAVKMVADGNGRIRRFG